MDLSIGDRVFYTRSNGLRPRAMVVGTAEDGVLHLEYHGPLGGNLTVCWAVEMEGSEVTSLNLGWQGRWTPSCIADSPLSTHLGSTRTGKVPLKVPSSPVWVP